MEWQPIETVPEDRYILLHYEGPFDDTSSPGITVGKWLGERGWWTTAIWAGSSGRGTPTHWMPLPGPPQSS